MIVAAADGHDIAKIASLLHAGLSLSRRLAGGARARCASATLPGARS
jgi:hypothetical protein